MKKLSLLLLIFLGSVGMMLAQRMVSGTITDTGGEALIGANVLVKGSDAGTITDVFGKYELNVPEGSNTLEVSYTGYNTQDVELGESNMMDIVLAEGVMLGDIVVTASGVARNSRDVVYANQSVSSEDLLKTPSKNALEALRGKAAGVRLSTGSGSVGASTRIILRGEGSLTGDNNALIVIDGIPIDNASSSAGTGTSTGGYADHGNRFNDINPDDIENITILKGPSATSLYGSRGASGVVLITTKKGSTGAMKFGVNSSFSTEKAYILMKRQNGFGQGYDNAHFDSGENWSWGPAFDGKVRPWTSPVDADGDGAKESLTRPYSAVDNQLQEFFNTGSTLNNGFYFSGGSDAFTYYASYSNTDQKGILDNTKYKRNTVTLKASSKLSDKLKSDFKVSYAKVNQNTAQEGSRAFEGNNAYAMAIQSPVNIPFGELRDYKSPFHDINGYWGSYSSVNPYYILNEFGNEGKINNFLGNASLTYSPIEGLDLVGRFGTNVVTTDISTWNPKFKPQQQLVWGDGFSLTTRGSRHESIGGYANYAGQTTNLDFSGFANYSRDLNADLSLDISAGYNWFQRSTKYVEGSTNGGLVVPGWYNLANSVEASRSEENSSLYRLYGALSNVRLGYKNAMFLEYSARNDWSSTLPSANNSFFYQAVGLSAIVTELLGMDNKYLNFMKFRTSYGTSGKDAGLYLLQSAYIGNPTLVGLGDYSINLPLNGQPGFTTSNKIGNPNLRPELTTTFEVGADVGLLNDRLELAYTYYSSNHSDQIVEISLPRSTGFTQTVSNIGRMTNKGHELSLTLKPIEGLVKDLHWDLFVAYSKNKNEVVKITDDISELVVGGPYTPGVSVVAKEGLPFGTYKAQAPLLNDAGQTVVDSVTGYPLYTDDEVYLGSYQPDYTMSYGSSIEYKGFGFNILFDVKKGGSFVSQTKFFTEFNGTAAHTAIHNREPYIIDNSVKLNAEGEYVANDIEITEQDYFTNYDPANSTFIVDASYVKLRELGMSYTLPASMLKSMPVSGVRVSLFGKNLKFWLPEGNAFADPEVNGPSLTGNAQGIETTQVPTAKSMGVSLNITF